jgi:hypothetical protein
MACLVLQSSYICEEKGPFDDSALSKQQQWKVGMDDNDDDDGSTLLDGSKLSNRSNTTSAISEITPMLLVISSLCAKA